jgi:hypothetical protein
MKYHQHNVPFVARFAAWQYRLTIAFLCFLNTFTSAGQAATFVVDTISDKGEAACTVSPADCSLRGAITNANDQSGPDTVAFNLPSDASDSPAAGFKTFSFTHELPRLTDPGTLIDGYSQPGYRNLPRIILSGYRTSSSFPSAVGLAVAASGCRIRGLTLHGWDIAVRIAGPDAHSNQIEGCYIGTDASGTLAAGNRLGVEISFGAHDNTIGGLARNIISSNTQQGILISGAGSNDNGIAGNFIGLNARGDGILGNSEGILINQGARRCTIGSYDIALRNVISGNGELNSNPGSSFGIRIDGIETTNHTIINCYIGVDATGSKSGFGNKGPGVLLSDSSQNHIGVPGAPRNIISGNTLSNNATSNIEIRNASRNTIQNNFIGPKADGSNPVTTPATASPQAAGIFVGSFFSSAPSQENLIGGTATGARNIISGNNDVGVFLANNALGTRIQGNFIGTNAAGNAVLPNSRNGIYDLGIGTLIGGTIPQARNVISGNGMNPSDPFSRSVGILAGGPNGVIQGNFIGTDARGTAALPNQKVGVSIARPILVGGATSRPGTGAGNLISGNIQTGIAIDSSGSVSTSSVHVSGNLIGTDVLGAAAIPNGIGIILYTGQNTAIGSGQSSGRNIISGNRGSGVQFESLSGTSGGIPRNNRIQGNYIGTDISGRKPLPNMVGVRMRQGSLNVVGGATNKPGTGVGNIISGNLLAGVYVERAFNVRPGIFGNAIGVAADGITPLPNKKSMPDAPDETGREGAGILVDQFVLIGGPNTNPNVPGKFGNLIAYNEGAGVRVLSGQPAQIRANSIFANGALGIDQGEVGVTPGVAAEDVSEPRFIIPPFPVLQSVTQSTPNAPLIIQGTVEASYGQLPVDVFASDEPDPSGFGEGKTYLGSFNLGTRQGIRFITFNQVLPVNADLSGKWITATISSHPSHANTSEFSEALQVVAAQGSTESSYSSINATAYASSASVVIAFDTSLQGIDLENVTAKVNGQSVPVQSVETNGQLLTVLLPEASFAVGDKVEIFWRDLQAEDGRKLTGNTPALVAE